MVEKELLLDVHHESLHADGALESLGVGGGLGGRRPALLVGLSHVLLVALASGLGLLDVGSLSHGVELLGVLVEVWEEEEREEEERKERRRGGRRVSLAEKAKRHQRETMPKSSSGSSALETPTQKPQSGEEGRRSGKEREEEEEEGRRRRGGRRGGGRRREEERRRGGERRRTGAKPRSEPASRRFTKEPAPGSSPSRWQGAWKKTWFGWSKLSAGGF